MTKRIWSNLLSKFLFLSQIIRIRVFWLCLGQKKVDESLLTRLQLCIVTLCFVSFLVIASPSYPYLSAPMPAVAASVPPPPPLEVGEASNLPPPPPPYSCDPSGSDLPQGKWILRLGWRLFRSGIRKKIRAYLWLTSGSRVGGTKWKLTWEHNAKWLRKGATESWQYLLIIKK